MKILEEIMDKPPIISSEERREVERLATAMGGGDNCLLDCHADFAVVLSIVLLAGMEALDGSP